MATMQSSSTTAPAVTIVPADWCSLADAASYYPHDLPEDWRLGYFANEHAGVYVPRAVWGRATAEMLRSWREDVHGRFGFFLEWPSDAAATDAGVASASAVLRDNLVAWVRWSATPAEPGALLATAAPGKEAHRVGQALHCPPALLDDPRGAADWLRRSVAAASATLAVLPRPGSAQLTQWRQLAALLGFAELSPSRG